MPVLSLNSQKLLLDLARRSIQTYLGSEAEPAFEPSPPEVLIPRGCFVTLRKHGALRGCIGTFDDSQPLYQAVMRMAVAAAVQDPRFAPLVKSELDEVRIEISVLGELQKMKSLEELELGKHGILIRYGLRSGAFLPQVAVEQGWSQEEFLTACALEKAGLSPRECSQADVYLFEVEKFLEPD